MAKKTMIASGMTSGQIENIIEKFRAAMRKHCRDINTDVVQQVLGIENLGMELYAVVRKHAERFSNMIVRRVKVNRSQTQKQVLDATGRRQYVTDSVVKTMPRDGDGETEVVFFKPDPEVYKHGWISNDDVAKEYDKHGLEPDPYAQAKVNEDDPDFADTHPNACQWKDVDGNWCHAAFYRWYDERYVRVFRHDDAWHDYWFFAGVRKS